MRNARHFGKSLIAIALVLPVFACGNTLSSEVDDGDFREDVIECEEAAAHIQECCPGASLPDCHYSRVDYYCGSWPYKTLKSSSITMIC